MLVLLIAEMGLFGIFLVFKFFGSFCVSIVLLCMWFYVPFFNPWTGCGIF